MRLRRGGRGTGATPLSKRALLQHVNRELWTFAGDERELVLYCECGHDDCTASIQVTRDEFVATRVHAPCALVLHRHKGIFEPVLERHANFLVVADVDVVDTTMRETSTSPPPDDPSAD